MGLKVKIKNTEECSNINCQQIPIKKTVCVTFIEEDFF